MKISHEELYERQNKWSLTQKIDHSLGVIDAFLHKFPDATVAFSGGVDSTVLLFLVRMIRKNQRAVFVNTTNELSDIVKFVKTIEGIETIHPEVSFSDCVQKYGFPMVSKKVADLVDTCRHPTEKNAQMRRLALTGLTKANRVNKNWVIPKKWTFLLHTKFNVASKCCYFLKEKPFALLQKTGTFIGTLAEDSRTREMSYMKVGCINEGMKKATPLSIWKKEEIWTFIKQNKLPYSDAYHYEKFTGCAYCAFGCQFDSTRFSRLQEREPKRFAIIMNLQNNGVTYREALKICFGRRIFEQNTKTLFSI